jgi:2-polyprenyl-6-methoxyphenol hydroxylase-like FAD-dependent oxidoreductase
MGGSENTPSEPHVLVIGAGLTGLILAHGLDKHGIKYDIFDDSEAAGSYAAREWTMGIHWSYQTLVSLLPEQISSRLVSEAAVDKSLDYSSAPYNGFVMYDGKTGNVLSEVSSEDTLLRVSRRKFRTLLDEGINVKVGALLFAVSVPRILNGNTVRSQAFST